MSLFSLLRCALEGPPSIPVHLYAGPLLPQMPDRGVCCLYLELLQFFPAHSCFPPQISWNKGVDLWWHELMQEAGEECEPEWCDAEDPLFILYTSGSTGKPKASGVCV